MILTENILIKDNIEALYQNNSFYHSYHHMIHSTEYQKGSFRHKSSTPTNDELLIYPSNKLQTFKQNPGKLYFSALQATDLSPSRKANKLRSREQRKSIVDYPPKARWPNSSSEKDTSEALGLTKENSKGPLDTKGSSKTPKKGDQILRASYLKARVDRRFNSSDYSINSKENLGRESPKYNLSGLSTQDSNVKPPIKLAHKIHLQNDPLNTSGMNLSTLNEGLNTSMGYIQTKPNSTTNTQPDYIFTKGGVKQRKRAEQGPIRAEHSFELSRITSPQEAMGIVGMRDNSRHARISRLKKAFGNSPVLTDMKDEIVSAIPYSNSSKKDSRTAIGLPKAQGGEELKKKRSTTMERYTEGGYDSEKERKSIRRKESHESETAVGVGQQRERSREVEGYRKPSLPNGKNDKHMPQVMTEQRAKNVTREVENVKRRETPKNEGGRVKEEKNGMQKGISFSALINNDGDLNIGDMVNIEEMHYSFVKFHQRTKQIMSRIKQAC